MFDETKQLFSLSLIGWPLVLVGSTLLALSWSEYDIVRHTLSVLASVTAPTRLAMSAIFVISGLMTILYGYKLNSLLKDEIRSLSTGNLLIFAGTLLTILAFVPGGVAMGIEVETQGAHNTIASILIIVFIIAPLVFVNRMKRYQEWHKTLIVVLAITVIKVVIYIASVVVVFVDWNNIAGLLQRLGLFLDSVWSIYVSYKLIQFY